MQRNEDSVEMKKKRFRVDMLRLLFNFPPNGDLQDCCYVTFAFNLFPEKHYGSWKWECGTKVIYVVGSLLFNFQTFFRSALDGFSVKESWSFQTLLKNVRFVFKLAG